MAEYIEKREYCQNQCRCDQEFCDRDTCPIWKAPAADVEPVRHAYWVPEERVDRISEAVTYRNTRYLCSACGRALVAWEKPIDAPYCHCGAKMDGKKEKLEKLLHANFKEPDINVCIEYENGNT